VWLEPEPPPGRSPSASACEPYRELIELGLSRGRNAKAIWQDLVDTHSFTASYRSVQRFIGKLLRSAAPEARAVIETPPGEEAQVDYGEGGLTRDPRTGKYRKPRLFVMTLGMSRHAFRKVVWRSSQQTWCELHEEAFAYFGGAPKTIRLDNLKEGVLDADIYEPELNALYAAMLSVGATAPDFHSQVVGGDQVTPISLSDFHGHKLVLYFYPKDNTPGCTKEACAFRDGYADRSYMRDYTDCPEALEAHLRDRGPAWASCPRSATVWSPTLAQSGPSVTAA